MTDFTGPAVRQCLSERADNWVRAGLSDVRLGWKEASLGGLEATSSVVL